MDLVKLEIDGKRIIADNSQTILEVARANGIDTIPTLCNDEQLEPFSSCFVCVVKVKGARTLLPACSTKVSAGMSVETENEEIRQSRRASLELMLSNHYADCIGPCQLACPAGIDIQGYIALAALGKYRDAIQLIKEMNPLPAICGRVCTRPCEVSGCRRNMLDEPVGIDFIKRYIADIDLGARNPFRPQTAPPNGKKVAVVGAGPAGLSCSYYLAIRGYDVRMFEALPEAGGMLRYGIPEYRLPKDVLDHEVNGILELGVQLSTNVALGKDFTVNGLKEKGYDAVFLGLGAWKSSLMRVQNEETEGVLPGIDFLRTVALGRSPELSGTVLVVGGGNTAIDCARTALRLGADKVKLLYRRTRNEMPANDVEIVEADHEGVEMEFLTAPTRVIATDGRVTALECLRMELGMPDESGRRSPKPIRGSEFTIDCDFVIAAIGQATRVRELVDGTIPKFLPVGEVLNLTRWNTIQAGEETYETSVEGVFAGGDVVTGAATAIEAIAAGRKAAHAIDAYLTAGKAAPEPFEFFSKKDRFRKVTVEDLNQGPTYARRTMPALPEEERVAGFAEVETGYSAEDTKLESHRCLECGCSALFRCDLRKYATEYHVELDSFVGEAKRHEVDRTHPLIHLDPNKCILCGRCVRICNEVVGASAYGFIDRGFNTIVKPELGGSLLDTECVNCGLCIATCPTAAIDQMLPLDKPGPWATDRQPTVCHYCGVGCRLDHETFGDSLVRVARFEGDSITEGNHCKKGRFGFNYVQAPDRFTRGMIRAGRELQDADLEETIAHTALRLKELTRKYDGEEIALFVSPRMTNEEAYLAQKFARVALKTNNVTSLSRLVNRKLSSPSVVSTTGYAELRDAQAILVVNSNVDEENFVVDLQIKKAIRNGGKLIYVGPEENRVSRFAEVFLRCADGTQPRLLLDLLAKVREIEGGGGALPPALAQLLELDDETARREPTGVDPEALAEAAGILSESILKVLAFNKDYRGLRRPGDEDLIAAVAGALGCGVLAMHEKANTQGHLDLGVDPRWFPGYAPPADPATIDEFEKQWCVSLQDLRLEEPDVEKKLREKRIRVAIVLGEDPFGAEGYPREILDGLLAADFLVVGDQFQTATVRMANVALPLSSAAETSGTMTSLERRVQPLERAVPPRSGMETWEILTAIAAGMGLRFKMKYTGVAEISEEIARVVPSYAPALAGTTEAGVIWDLASFPLTASDPDRRVFQEAIRPERTLRLDYLEARFERWFEEVFRDARA
ncbi:MAG: molybdopterin-dependent oxidoreductase, partial [Candidatus Eisenbacteria bacterium]|nr:molybdopterin-dependent oxidoreductase [Candidatus Latescibacterota bacterium]MBD3302804.1 molybdopterin-dependent oxidoreductase [Candidatus Eisenbacteria bacterium]